MGSRERSRQAEDRLDTNVLVVFDLDHTLVNANCSFLFGRYLYRKKYFPIWKMLYLVFCYWQHKACGLSVAKLHRKIFCCLFQGQQLAEIRGYAEDFLDHTLTGILDSTVLAELRHYQRRGVRAMLLSSSPRFLVAAIAERLGIESFGGTEYLVGSDGTFATVGEVMEGETKAAKAQACSGGLAIVAYSDSVLDLPLLELASDVVVVRADRALRKLALQRQWRMIE